MFEKFQVPSIVTAILIIALVPDVSRGQNRTVMGFANALDGVQVWMPFEYGENDEACGLRDQSVIELEARDALVDQGVDYSSDAENYLNLYVTSMKQGLDNVCSYMLHITFTSLIPEGLTDGVDMEIGGVVPEILWADRSVVGYARPADVQSEILREINEVVADLFNTEVQILD